MFYASIILNNLQIVTMVNYSVYYLNDIFLAKVVGQCIPTKLNSFFPKMYSILNNWICYYSI